MLIVSVTPDKVKPILSNIVSENDFLTTIKMRLKDGSVSFDEISCVLSYVKSKNRSKNVVYHVNWYKKVHCLRKCYLNKKQRKECADKFDTFISKNSDLKMKRQQFIDLFNNHLTICVLLEKEKRGYVSWKQFQILKPHIFKKKILENQNLY